jgi:hypothetical protein
VFASAGALSSAGVVVAYYRPGLSDNTDWLGQLMVLGPAAAAMAMPFVLLGVLLRVPIVWAPCGLLMLAITAWTGADLLRGGEAMFGASLLVFALLFATSIVLVLVALAVDVPVRAVVKRRRDEMRWTRHDRVTRLLTRSSGRTIATRLTPPGTLHSYDQGAVLMRAFTPSR